MEHLTRNNYHVANGSEVLPYAVQNEVSRNETNVLFEREVDSRLWLAATVISSFALRLAFFNFESGDYQQWIKPWSYFFIDHGRWQGLGQLTDQISNYPPLYMYFVSLSTLLPLPQLYSIKLLSVAVDYLAAWYLWRLMRLQGERERTALIAVTIFLFLPTVVMNGAQWGQCDIMYTAGLLASLYYLLADRPLAALVAFGVSCSLKPQAIFWCPLLAALLLSGRLPWKYIWVPGAVYATSCLPAILAGRPGLEVLLHWGRIRYRRGLTFHASNWYQWVDYRTLGDYRFFWWLGIALTALASLLLILYARSSSVGQVGNSRLLIMLAVASVLFSPFFLPKMHERYFFPAEVLSIVYAAFVPSGWVVAVLLQVVSVFTYLSFLYQRVPIPFSALATLAAIAIAWVTKDLLRAGERNGRLRVSAD